jgi:hypothetical protein
MKFIKKILKAKNEKAEKTGMSEQEAKEAGALWKNKGYRKLVKKWEEIQK